MTVPLLDAYRFCSYCGGKLTHMGDFAYDCLQCDKKSYLSPALGCNCILLQDDKALMTQRARKPGIGTWSLPGGFAHPSERCHETMIREAQEELSVSISVDHLIGSDCCDYEYQGIARPVLVVYGVGHIVSGEIQCKDDVSDYAWLTLKEIETLDLFHPFEVQMIQEAFDYRNRI